MGLQYTTLVILYTLERRLRNTSVTKKKGVSHIDIRGKTYQVKKKKKNLAGKKKIQQRLKCDRKGGRKNELRGKAGRQDTQRLTGYGEGFAFCSEIISCWRILNGGVS